MHPLLVHFVSLTIGVASATPSHVASSWRKSRSFEDAKRGEHALAVRDVSIASSLPSSWTYVGCQSDSVAARTLSGAQFFDNTVDAATCIDFCISKGFIYAGTEYSNECYCANSVSTSSSQESDDDCNMPCAGNAAEACGGSSRLSLFWSGQGPPPAAVTNPGPGNWTSVGCYVDQQARTLSQQVATPGGGPQMTVEGCTSSCFEAGFMYAGLEYSSECWCGNVLNGKPATDNRCSMLCNGNSGEFCGGSYGLSVYGYGLPKHPVECPRWDQYNETFSDGSIVLYECFVDHAGADMGMTYEQSYESCAATCAQTFGCAAFSWLPPQGGPCYLKSSVGASNSNQGVWGGRIVNSVAGPPVSSLALPSSTKSIVATPAKTPNTAPSGAVGCPGWDYANYTSPNGAVMLMECYADHAGSDLSMAYVDGYKDCADLCATTVGCRAFSWLPPQGGPCYMKTAAGPINTNNGVWGGKVLALPPPSASSSSTSSRHSLSSSTLSGTISSSIASSSGPETLSRSTSMALSPVTPSIAAPVTSSFSESSSSSSASTETRNIFPTSLLSSESNSVISQLSSPFTSSAPPSQTSSEFVSTVLPSSLLLDLHNSSEGLLTSTSASMSESMPLAASGPASVSDVSSSASMTTSSSSLASSSTSSFESSAAQTTLSGFSSSLPDSASTFSPSSEASSSSSSTTSSSSSSTASSSNLSQSMSSDVSSSLQSTVASETQTVSSTISLNITSSAGPSASPSPQPPHWYYAGCYTDSTAKRALTYSPPLPNGNSVENCQTACKTAGYLLAGMEYGAECYCGNNVLNGNGPAPNGEVGCNMACSANSTETCGGSNRLSLWAWSTWNAPSSTTSGTASTTSALPTTSATIPANWTYAGCYYDNYAGYGRVMKNEQPDDNQMTIASCTSLCSTMGYSVAGMEYGVQCFCDGFLRNGAPQAPDTDCNMACSGDASSMCGAGDRLTVWSLGNLTVLPVPSIPKANIPKNWTYVGCLFDSVTAARPLPYKLVDSNNTVANCITQCQKFGYPAAGVEYGEECYCGDYADYAATGPQIQPDTECNMPCAGNASELCGTGGRLQTYTWNSTTPLNDWHYASDVAAGEYKYMMGGVVVPLQTTFGINNKITFMEKHGTGPPNSTGAYEYDPSILDFNTAWRTMHVKTDIFCAAGLILPDKAGREINVGGWSNDALSGIRLYTPDGSPGVAGTNDWQENVEVLGLQDGRWYPTAMIMANGTILVVGGQDGSNGPPVPTLELLPTQGPALFMQWLRDTDPWNLYPFLAVMRGGIFAAYYNEARILDENTFDTIRVLPPIPGAVNAPKGGRTYPLEGTMVLLPQHAPYSDSLEVLICGGSTVDNAALDNCVTTKPEDPNAEWVIERMPSKRVMTCMTALPDGTYLIVNGAQRGQAGFALADMPNLNAVLYDPSKPVGSRMTVMANTTLARMYHSEAILMNDGRVVISGSDPLDERFPEQYIVEQFLPPYLLNGKPNPSFQISNKDWTWGESITVTGVSAPNAGIGSLKFSMLGAVTSTHSNSMGQRTLFPSVSCSGSTCTISAPPSAHIAPPSWYQLFAVDDGQPSEGIWIRLGHDPAELGNWPAGLEDFAPLPGI